MIDPTLLHAACAANPHVAAAWVSPCCTAFAIQAVIGRKRTSRDKWTHVEPLYATPAHMADLRELAARFEGIRFVSATTFHPGGWDEVYRRRVEG